MDGVARQQGNSCQKEPGERGGKWTSEGWLAGSDELKETGRKESVTSMSEERVQVRRLQRYEHYSL